MKLLLELNEKHKAELFTKEKIKWKLKITHL